MFYFVYQTTNIKNGKIYIGVHRTENLDDGYLGSGKNILHAIRKYGEDAFERTIIEMFDCIDDAFAKEAELVNEDFVARRDTYNIAVGGSGGSILRNRKPFTGKHSDESRAKISGSCKGRRHSEEELELMRMNNWARKDPERQREHARYAGSLSWNDRTAEGVANTYSKVSKSLKEYFKENGSPVKGIKRERVICPHCGKSGANNTMSRWHFDRCRNKTVVH